MEESLKWTERINLSEVRDPLQLAVFRYPDGKFLPGITTQTLRIRYFTYMTWVWDQIKKRKEKGIKRSRDLEKILVLVSAHHHENNDAPKGILNITSAREFLKENKIPQIDLDKFEPFGKKNKKKGYGHAYYAPPLATLDIKWGEKDEVVISPAGEGISNIFSGYIEKIEDKIWSKTLTKSDLEKMSNLCCCSISTQEQNFWKKVFFGLTKKGNNNALEIDDDKQLEIIDADKLQFRKNSVDEFGFVEQLEIGDDKDAEFELDNQHEGETESEMRKATLFLLLEIIKNSKPDSSGDKLYQTIRDSIYYSQFKVKDEISQIDFNQKLESYRKYWEVYAHNQYYVTIFEKTLSVILDISKHNPHGIEIDKLVKKIDSKEFLDSINKNFAEKLGFQISDSDSVQTVYDELEKRMGGKKTELSSPINEHDILENIQNTDDFFKTETLGFVFVLFLLCKYRYFSFDDNALRMNNAIDHLKWNSVKPETRYDEFGKVQVTKFPEELLRFVIKRYRFAGGMKMANKTRAWLFTVVNDILSFTDQGTKKPKEFNENLYRDKKWNIVLELLNDLGLVKKNNKNWEITEEGKIWLNKIQ